MAQNILALFVYMLLLTLAVTVVNSFAAVFQLIEDLPVVRKKLWIRQHRKFPDNRNTRN